MSKVIILGAGSSKDCGFPLGNEVWQYLNYYDANGSTWYNFMNNIFPQFSAKYAPYPTFELTLTLIDNYIKNRQNLGNYPESELIKIKQSLVNSYREIFYMRCLYAEYQHSDYSLMSDAQEVYENFNQWYEPFFKQIIKKNNDIVFISLNYDVLIDIVLSNMADKNEIQDFTYGFDVYRLDKQNEQYRKGGTLLLKPHGSLNLAQCLKCNKVYAPSFSAQGVDGLIQDNGYKCKDCNDNLYTLILPPMFNKNDKDNPYVSINQKIIEVLSEATEILIIGYSLPDYDFNILEAFLNGSIKNNNRFKLEIKIIDKNENNSYINLKYKYDNIFHRIAKENYFIEGFKNYAMRFLNLNNNKVVIQN
jgi:hypothetical protein